MLFNNQKCGLTPLHHTKILPFSNKARLRTGFVQVLEILGSPGIFSPGKLMQVLESPGNL